MTEPAFDRLLGSLVQAEIDFVVVGGLALGAWGVVRGTRALEVVVDEKPANLTNLAVLAESLDCRVQDADAFLSSATAIGELLRAGARVQIETTIGPLDVVQRGYRAFPSSGNCASEPSRLTYSTAPFRSAPRRTCAR